MSDSIHEQAAAHAGDGLLVVVSGPSGVGKTTIVRAVLKSLDGLFSVSATTRSPRPGEQDGRDYYFVSLDQFKQMREQGEFLEHAQVFGRDWYGTPAGPVRERIAAGRIVMLDIDVQGALQVRRAMPEALLIFVKPPSDDALLARLRGRADVPEDQIQRRFAEAKHEMETAGTSGAYNHFIVNDDLEQAIADAQRVIQARRDARHA